MHGCTGPNRLQNWAKRNEPKTQHHNPNVKFIILGSADDRVKAKAWPYTSSVDGFDFMELWCLNYFEEKL